MKVTGGLSKGSQSSDKLLRSLIFASLRLSGTPRGNDKSLQIIVVTKFNWMEAHVRESIQ